MSFVHLHVHTEYSLLDGACRVRSLIDTAAAMGQKSVAITDHGVMYGVIDFYKYALEKGVQPIIGCEVYVAPRSRFDKTHELDSENRHLVLLCENNTGYQNLIALVSKSWTEGFYSKPRVDYQLLEQYHDGLIALSACLAGEIPRALAAGNYRGAKEAALRYREIFGKDHFYIELQDHNLPQQQTVNPQLLRLCQETGIEPVVTNDCHYIEKQDSRMHHILVCIQTNRTVEDTDTLEFGSEEFYLKSEEEMRALFPTCPRAADNTVRIAQRCHVEFEFGKTKLPAFVTPNGQENDAYFRQMCYDGLRRRYGDNPQQALKDRLEYELTTIETMGYVNYYLIVHDFIRYAKSVDIPVGYGRGSGVGSLAAYCMGITGVDPIRYDLLFERFLNTERVSMPDFDIDFSDERRQEIIDYVIRKYGADHVAQIVTFGTMAARGAVRDVGRAMAIPYAVVDGIAKLIPMELSMTLAHALETSPQLKQKYDTDPQVHELLDMAQKIEGMPRHASTHAAGVVITDKPVMAYVPLAKNDESVVTQYTMTAIEELGLLKMDFLGLRNLSVIDNAVKMIRLHSPQFSLDTISYDDAEVFEMLSAANTEGVFQFESAGMRRVLTQLHPQSVEDLIAIISLYRPGPMKFIPAYIENRHHPEKIVYRTPRLKKILDVTYGCIVYQEQVMQIFRELAGYPLGRADLVRRAMSKKKHGVMMQEQTVFIEGQTDEAGNVTIEGCLRRGVDRDTAQAIFGEMESFASYAFNKSHASAYAMLSYQTAYLKCKYPKEYMSALLSSVLGWADKVAVYMEECKRLQIQVLPPHVNESETGFTVFENSIRFGLLAVKNLGRSIIAHLVQQRQQGGAYTSFYDFCKRMQGKDLNRRAVESLVKCGALDGLGSNRHEMLAAVGSVLDAIEADKRRNFEGQLGLFEQDTQSRQVQLASLPDYTQAEKLAMEKEVTGMYISGHPMSVYAPLYADGSYASAAELAACSAGESDTYRDNDKVTVLGMVTAVSKKTTKSNATMAFVTLEDMTGSVEMLVFAQAYLQYASFFAAGKILRAVGRISFTEEKDPKLVCDYVTDAPDAQQAQESAARMQTAQKTPEKAGQKRSFPGLYIKFAHRADARLQKAHQYLDVFDGNTPVYFYYADSKQVEKLPPAQNVDVNAVLVRTLKKLLGDENVAVRE